MTSMNGFPDLTDYYELFKCPISIKAEVMYTLQECRDRCLHHGTKFLTEILVAFENVPPFFDHENEDNNSIRFEFEPAFTNLGDYLVYSKARAYFDLEDYPGCAHITKYTNNSKSMFLHYMARYLCMHNESIYERTNIFDSHKPLNMRKYMDLLEELLILNVYGTEDDSEEDSDDDSQPQGTSELINMRHKNVLHENDSTPKGRRYSRRPRSQKIEKISITTSKRNNKNTKRNTGTRKLKVNTLSAGQSETSTSTGDHKEPRIKREDPYLLWLTAVMLKKIDRCDEAVDLLVKAIRIQPCHWGAWLELSTLIQNIYMLNVLNSRIIENNERHWMQLLFIAHVYIDFQIIDKAVSIYHDVLNFGDTNFHNWPYIHSQLAIAHHNKRGKNEIASSIKSFSTIINLDPYRIDHFDLLSNLMYVCENREEIVILSKYLATIDRYRQETLCVLGNMYSIKSDHTKSVLYFKKAVRMNPFHVTAWTLLGHEYIEMKNSSAAIISYRQALKINMRDYRAWYGLGQIYELVKLPHYALYYFAQARRLRPKDSRMLLALGEMFERTEDFFNALVCYYQALKFDNDGAALLKLGKQYDRYGQNCVILVRNLFETENRRALQVAIGGKTDDDYEMIQAKIYLYLAHQYMDQHNFDRALELADKCRELYIDPTIRPDYSKELDVHSNALINEIEARAGSDCSPGSTSGALKARRFLFAL